MVKKEEAIEYTKYEKARMIGSRALQISMGAPFVVKLSDKELEGMKYNPLEIAKMEFKEGVLPITIKRPMPMPRAKAK
jgi:DNA-directed RNA polymerase subunit K